MLEWVPVSAAVRLPPRSTRKRNSRRSLGIIGDSWYLREHIDVCIIQHALSLMPVLIPEGEVIDEMNCKGMFPIKMVQPGTLGVTKKLLVRQTGEGDSC